MASGTSSRSSGGIGFVWLLTILFIALKLTGYITWTWVWVLSPIWITLSIVAVIVAVILVLAVIIHVVKK